ncbi:MAG: ankyrin repeat domain-containing protein, partial [Verrucomicrobiota bacterium]|nr:ankyrin repeat domain-containing protein [Verrucomicrobiota bacterium]
MAAGTDVNAKDEEGWTPLHIAAIRGNKEIAELLIAKGADVNAANNVKLTPLDLASDEVVGLLLKQGGKRGSILGATRVGNLENVKELLDAGADVNAKSEFGSTIPLHVAAINGYKEIAELLITGGADVNAKDISG